MLEHQTRHKPSIAVAPMMDIRVHQVGSAFFALG